MKHAHVGHSVHTHSTAGFAHPHSNVTALGIKPGMVVADFGAGSGHYVQALAEKVGPEGKVYAIDVQKDLLRRIVNESNKRGHHNVHILWGDLEKDHGSKLSNESCDLVLISNMLFQTQEKEKVLREAKR